LKRDTNVNRTDNSKPLYLDDLKRYQKLKQIGDKNSLGIIQHNIDDIKRNFKDINIFNISPEKEDHPKSKSPEK
jgi:hypothetical protein